ncbi:four-carbon acid sugar kinase family protein [Streptomyces purpureus]|uniref:Membrane protein n=1 Tax=Streptomyces purpureus TaxID=1951 RepID=A0A918GXE9_9ACTN|nr:four-carbon acid sugar kinase family protein [Streptomyces purpureus]GGT17051.1 membrane protein [Streptomyces purpureus]
MTHPVTDASHPAGPAPSAVAVLADDLTSAGDGAAPFRAAGHEARLLLCDPPSFAAQVFPPLGTGVTALDLGTRVLDEAQAAHRTGEAAGALAAADLLVKTVDSTLRGHLASEVRAAWAGSGRRAVVLAPAFPAEGRVTVGGVQFVRGVPVHESEFARDPVHPVTCSDLSLLFPDAVLVGPDRLAGLPQLIDEGGLFVCCAVRDEDLDALVASVTEPEAVLWVGSPGLAAALARRRIRTPAATPPTLTPALRPLVVVGSANPSSLRQLDLLHDRSGADGATVTADPGQAVTALRRMTTSVRTLRMPAARHDPATARILARSLADAACALVESSDADALVLTGGETAVTVLTALGAAGIRLVDEPEPGVARGLLTGLGGTRGPDTVPVLIKAGGFGDDGTLLRLAEIAAHPHGRRGSTDAADRGGRR